MYTLFHKFTRTYLPAVLLISGITLSNLVAAQQNNSKVEVITVTSQKVDVGSVAPTQSSLKATQPQSIINRSFFEDAKSPASDFSSIAAIAPSVSAGISPNGPGLSETKNGLRGFKDGEYNITFDGVPFGDTNGPTHHSTAYFPAEVLGMIDVERGPGNASNLGQATFGGSINLFSRDLAKKQTISPIASMGSDNTRLLGMRFDSGDIDQYGDLNFAINAQKLTSDGYRTNSPIQGKNLMLKAQKPFGEGTVLTVNLNHNSNWYYQNDKESGLTLAQATLLGKNYALGLDPLKANYTEYNRVAKSTNFDYVRLESELGAGWAIDNNAYYYEYTNNGLSSKATNLTAGFSNVKTITNATITNQMDGYKKTNEYSVRGDIFKVTNQTSLGLARVGLWAEKADTHRSQYEFNLLNGITPNYNQAKVVGAPVESPLATFNNTVYEQESGWKQYQPFAEFEWQAMDNLKVTPGVKYMHTVLSIDATVNQTARIEQHLDKTFTATLPFLTANYTINPNMSVYAQYAKGMLVPDISAYQSANADASDIYPQTSTNYQTGFVYQLDKLAFDANVYYIDFNNKIAVVPGSPASQPIFYNEGGVKHKGLEGQVTYALTESFSLYANGSLNRAATKATGLQTAGVPDTTSALGVLYRSGGLGITLFQKRVGRTYALDDEGYPLDAYGTTDLNLSYKISNLGAGFDGIKLALGINNLLDKEDIISVKPTNTTSGTAAYGTPSDTDTFLWQPGRTYMVTLRAEY